MKNAYKMYLKSLIQLALMIAVFQSSAFAQCNPSGTPFGGGDGSVGTPYQICSPDQLNAIGGGYSSSHFDLEADIDLSGIPNFNMISSNYTGTFDGKGHKISNFTRTSNDNLQGMFRDLSGTVRDLTIENGLMTITGISAQHAILAGSAYQATISNVNISGSVLDANSDTAFNALLLGQASETLITDVYVSGTVTGGGGLAGLVGTADNGGVVIQRSTALVNITGGQVMGALVGRGGNDMGFGDPLSITESVGLGTINVTNGTTGGLVGICTSCSIVNSYAQVSIISTGTVLGGLVGRSEADMDFMSPNSSLSTSYSTGSVSGSSSVGGAVGYATDTNASDIFWDTQTSGQASSAVGSGLTTSQAKQEANYTGFDFTNIWQIDEGNNYPVLRNNVGLPTNTPTATPTNTNTPTATATFTASNTPTNTATATATNTSTSTATSTATATLTPSLTPTNTVTPSLTPTQTATATSTITPRATATPLVQEVTKSLKVSLNTKKAGVIKIKFLNSFKGNRDYRVNMINARTQKQVYYLKPVAKGRLLVLDIKDVPPGEYRLYVYVRNGGSELRSPYYTVTVN